MCKCHLALSCVTLRDLGLRVLCKINTLLNAIALSYKFSFDFDVGVLCQKWLFYKLRNLQNFFLFGNCGLAPPVWNNWESLTQRMFTLISFFFMAFHCSRQRFGVKRETGKDRHCFFVGSSRSKPPLPQGRGRKTSYPQDKGKDP